MRTWSALLTISVVLALGSASARGDSVLGAPSRGHSSPAKPTLARLRGGSRLKAAVAPVVRAAEQKLEEDKASSGPAIAGILSVLGGTLLHMTLGTMYCWGSFIGYMPPSMRFLDGAAHPGRQPDALLVIPLLIASQMLAMPVGAKLQKSLGPKASILIGSGVMNLGIVLASYATNLRDFLLGYSLMFGVGVGLGYTAPMGVGWKWFPRSKGLVNGAVLLGFGFGGFVFTLLGAKIANPEQLKLVDGVFPDAVYALFPKMLRTLAVCYAVLGVLSAVLVRPPPPAAPVASGELGAMPMPRVRMTIDRTFNEAMRSPTFYLLWLTILLAAPAGLNVAAVYKTFALSSPALADDGFLSLAGGLATLCNGLGRVGWAALSDVIGFKKTFAALALTQIGACALYTTPAVLGSRPLFLALTCTFLACMGGNFAMFPTVCANTFGARDGAAVYAVLFSAFGTASIAAVTLTKELQRVVGWPGVFRIFAGMSAVALALSLFYQPLKPRLLVG